jgi:hypothetical protein
MSGHHGGRGPPSAEREATRPFEEIKVFSSNGRVLLRRGPTASISRRPFYQLLPLSDAVNPVESLRNAERPARTPLTWLPVIVAVPAGAG